MKSESIKHSEINNDIITQLSKLSHNNDDCITYLLCVYLGLKPTFIPNNIKIDVHRLGIYSIINKKVKWHVPLFQSREKDFDWVIYEYIPLFARANPERAKHQEESVKRMKVLFNENPDLTKEKVISGTRSYIHLNQDKLVYIKNCHYFIYKGQGKNKVSDLLAYCNSIRSSTHDYNIKE